MSTAGADDKLSQKIKRSSVEHVIPAKYNLYILHETLQAETEIVALELK